MNPNRKINPEKINIINIKTKKGNIDAGDDNQLQNIRGYTFNFNVGSGFNQDKNIFGIELSVEIIAMDNSDVPLGPKRRIYYRSTFQCRESSGLYRN